jgi:hypothetical protein
MRGMRCKECGDVRWSFLGISDTKQDKCILCGGETVPERRVPDGARRGGIERRGVFEVAQTDTRRPTAPAS